MKRIIQMFILVLFLFCSFDPIVIAKEKSKFYFDALQETKEAKRVSYIKAYELYESGKALLISVDPKIYFKGKHIVGAINIPILDLEDMLKKGFSLNVPKDQIILLYCR